MAIQGTLRDRRQVSGWTIGFAVFAGSLMLLTGIFQALIGLAALFSGDFFFVGSNYIFNVDITTWGWIHLLMGLVVTFAGIGVFSGQTWARAIGILLAVLSAVANFFFIPYYPFWSLLIIGVDIGIIAALAAYGPAQARGY
jgi:hypothetical protein